MPSKKGGYSPHPMFDDEESEYQYALLGAGYYGATGTDSYVQKPPCHSGTLPVFVDPATGQQWYAGGTQSNFKRAKESVLVALTSAAIDQKVLGNIELLAPALPTVYLDWADQTAGPLKTKSSWEGLLRALRARNQPVSVCCVGGHGRTGTFLAIMSYLCGVTKKPIEFIRSNYCKEAVETPKQFKLVADITGVSELSLWSTPVDTPGYIWKGYNRFTRDIRGDSYNAKSNPKSENMLFGFFWGVQRIPNTDTEVELLWGRPIGEGEWKKDAVGYYWEWKAETEARYVPAESMAFEDVDGPVALPDSVVYTPRLLDQTGEFEQDAKQ